MNANTDKSVIDQCSLYPVYIEAIFVDQANKQQEIDTSSATGFVYEYLNRYYLVSNWHVFSGKHAITLKSLHTQAALPEKIRIHFPIEGKIGTTKTINCPLKHESNDSYFWLEHPEKNKIDVAALPIDWQTEYATYPINHVNEARGIRDFPEGFYVGQEVFILGYPRGIKGGGGLPIWKRATIAVEPYLSMDGNNLKILVDAATREGMSGSPVIVAGTPDSSVLFDGKVQVINIRPFKLFLGIYSGRIAGDDEFAAQLGIVWKEQAIREIIEANIPYCATDM
ncbi:trypsin-like peptidase domain-containing protein [Methylovulum psychrotolerans]|uniref:S1 family peptidase n=1 Tax=Methylovulum psychrotolerans TaxID=1704499 RepID=UPI001BFFB5CC|nr:serine protease [Methylovulum psychrotolerans]MBT9098722.1 trypsin-like peptidase domain-containing protein [Methylovulum psychrotolerans]